MPVEIKTYLEVIATRQQFVVFSFGFVFFFCALQKRKGTREN